MWSNEKQRRSRVDWFAILPDDVAEMQMAWERRQTALAMHNSGLKQKEIAELFGVTGSRVSQFVIKARSGRVPPVEKFFNRRPQGFASIADPKPKRLFVMRLP